MHHPAPSTSFSHVAERDAHAFFDRFGLVTRAVRAAAEEAYAALEIGSAQAKCLRHIGKNARISQADLARATRTAPTLIGRALEPLIERGWVRRKRSERDRREYVLELTASGQRARARVEEARGKIIARIDGALDQRDKEDFDRIAGKLLSLFEGG